MNDKTTQVRARTSAGYGAFSRRFEFQTSPYCEYRDYTINSRCQMQLCVLCSLCLIPRFLCLAVTATSERAQASIIAVAITLALVLLAVVAGFLLSGR